MSWKKVLKLSDKQKKIAEQAPPKDKITGEDFKQMKNKKTSKKRSAFTASD